MVVVLSCDIFSSPEPKAHGELIVYQSSPRFCVCLCVCPFQTCKSRNQQANHNDILSEASFGCGERLHLVLSQIRSELVSMATDSCNRVIMGKTVLPHFLSCFASDLFHTCR